MQPQKPTAVYWINNKLYLNITNKCSNNCWFCFRNFKQGVAGFNLKLLNEPQTKELFATLEEALNSRCWTEIIFCGFGEPTTELDLLLEIAKWIKKRLPKVPIRLDTNGHGYALNPGRNVVQELKEAGVSRASVSLNGYDSETYIENCRPTFQDAFAETLRFIKEAKAQMELEVSCIRMPEVDIDRVKTLVDNLGVPFRIRDYIPCFW
jgi:GTP 3',8-cyclase